MNSISLVARSGSRSTMATLRHFSQPDGSPLARAMSSSVASKRPMSPHLTIYEPQLTWIMSITHRITGGGLAAGVYAGGIAHLLYGVSGASVVAAVAGLPGVVLFAGKLVVAAPFTYHTFNGLRHLAWDARYFLSIKDVYTTGHVVNAATAISSLALALM